MLISMTEAYTQSVSHAGGCPVLVPLGLPDGQLKDIIGRVDGILFTGGGDIHPALYGSAAHSQVAEVDEDRDRVEIELFREAVANRIPFLGICRGLQVINTALGSTLYEDLLNQRPNTSNHDFFNGYPRDYLAHSVQLTPSSQLPRILSTSSLEVNSLHHQGIRELATGLEATAHAMDGVIEAIEPKDYSFGLAVQWHPEWLQAHIHMRALFQAFVQATANK
jgi:putative glutamine amidotransferase